MVKGDIVIVDFPYTNLSNTKRRPALVIANISDDLLLSQITTQKHNSGYNVKINQNSIHNGRLKYSPCYIRCHKIFIIHSSRIVKKVCVLNQNKLKKVTEKIKKVIDKG